MQNITLGVTNYLFHIHTQTHTHTHIHTLLLSDLLMHGCGGKWFSYVVIFYCDGLVYFVKSYVTLILNTSYFVKGLSDLL